jgi:hypothetical protein
MGLCHLMAGAPPALLLCGVSLGMETVFSGTPLRYDHTDEEAYQARTKALSRR